MAQESILWNGLTNTFSLYNAPQAFMILRRFVFDMFDFVFDIRDKYRRARAFLYNIAPIISLLSIFAASPDKDSRGGAR